jgi:hypothetical protein
MRGFVVRTAKKGKEGRMFFFEKKNQKTFTHGMRGSSEIGRVSRRQKFFGSFFQERTACLPFSAQACGG